MNIAHWLHRAALSHSELPAVSLGERPVSSYARLARRAAGLATALRGRYGLAPGDRVAIAAKNHPAYLEVLFGAWWGGIAVVPINAKLHPSEIAWIVEHAGARVAFATPDVEAALRGLDLGGVELVGLDDPAYERLASDEPAPVETRGPDELAWLFYTSGTTGRPKGAMLTHRNLIAMSVGYLADVDVTRPGDALLHAAPMSHGSGLYAMAHVCRRAVNVVPESAGFDADEVLALARRWPGTSMFAAPTMIQRLTEHPGDETGDGIRTLIWGGAPMHPTDVRRALDRFGPRLAQIYGQGESPMTITFLSKDDVADRSHPRWLERLGSAGIPSSVVEVRAADAEDQSLPAGEVGEVQVRGDTVMAGYWRDEDATRETLRDGWLHTGDIGSLDEDGYLTLKDRSKDVIISGGTNVYPREVEDVLLSHPKVRDISVIGRPDPEWGEVVIAYVVGESDPQELDRMCLERIARFKRPKDYVFLPSLPRNSTGKILKNELRALDRGENQ
jgi:long-chain acyl-CoA synthetase